MTRSTTAAENFKAFRKGTHLEPLNGAAGSSDRKINSSSWRKEGLVGKSSSSVDSDDNKSGNQKLRRGSCEDYDAGRRYSNNSGKGRRNSHGNSKETFAKRQRQSSNNKDSSRVTKTDDSALQGKRNTRSNSLSHQQQRHTAAPSGKRQNNNHNAQPGSLRRRSLPSKESSSGENNNNNGKRRVTSNADCNAYKVDKRDAVVVPDKSSRTKGWAQQSSNSSRNHELTAATSMAAATIGAFNATEHDLRSLKPMKQQFWRTKM